jgi:hypothetical protein
MPIWIASLSRCRSPPERVVSGWPSLQVSEPDVVHPPEDRPPPPGSSPAPPPKKASASSHRHREHLADVAAVELVLEDARLEPLALALLAHRFDGLHVAELGVDGAVAVADRAGALGVGRVNSAGLTPFALAKAFRIGSSSPV